MDIGLKLFTELSIFFSARVWIHTAVLRSEGNFPNSKDMDAKRDLEDFARNGASRPDELLQISEIADKISKWKINRLVLLITHNTTYVYSKLNIFNVIK